MNLHHERRPQDHPSAQVLTSCKHSMSLLLKGHRHRNYYCLRLQKFRRTVRPHEWNLQNRQLFLRHLHQLFIGRTIQMSISIATVARSSHLLRGRHCKSRFCIHHIRTTSDQPCTKKIFLRTPIHPRCLVPQALDRPAFVSLHPACLPNLRTISVCLETTGRRKFCGDIRGGLTNTFQLLR